MLTKSLRLAILDYPLQVLDQVSAQRMLGDMLVQKQLNFARTSPTFVVTDKHDMIGTHYLIYDTSQIFNPRLVAAIRTTFEDRALYHGVDLPIQNYYSALSPKAQDAYQDLRRNKGPITDCNAWFVDAEYSHAHSQMPLSEILFFSLCVYNLRLGRDHFVGATNERYKASRWVAKVGDFPDGLTFTHPAVPDLHKLTLVENFNPSWLRSCWNLYADLIRNTQYVTPQSLTVRSLDEISKPWTENLLERAA